MLVLVAPQVPISLWGGSQRLPSIKVEKPTPLQEFNEEGSALFSTLCVWHNTSWHVVIFSRSLSSLFTAFIPTAYTGGVEWISGVETAQSDGKNTLLPSALCTKWNIPISIHQSHRMPSESNENEWLLCLLKALCGSILQYEVDGWTLPTLVWLNGKTSLINEYLVVSRMKAAA